MPLLRSHDDNHLQFREVALGESVNPDM